MSWIIDGKQTEEVFRFYAIIDRETSEALVFYDPENPASWVWDVWDPDHSDLQEFALNARFQTLEDAREAAANVTSGRFTRFYYEEQIDFCIVAIRSRLVMELSCEEFEV